MTSDVMVVDVSQDWMVACDVQQRFMRGAERAAGRLDYSARCRQMRALGGDCYEFMALGENRLALTIGDASGKGLAAALMISNAQSSLRTATFFTGNDLAAAVSAVNRQVHACSFEDRYATLFHGVFDGASGELRFVNAGHNLPVVMRRDGSVSWLQTGGAPVGMFPDWKYEEGAVRLKRGDLVLAYTDGVIEAENPSGEEWGVDGLLRAVAGNREARADEVVDTIFTAMDEFSHGRQTDDATAIVLRVM